MAFNKAIIIVFTIFAFAAIACVDNTKDNPIHQDSTSGSSTKNEFKVGGLYISKNEDGTYSVYKVLALDDFAVHVRSYKEKFKEKPKQLKSANLHVSIGHTPIDIKGLLLKNPELIAVEEVKETELEGYKMYLEQIMDQNKVVSNYML